MFELADHQKRAIDEMSKQKRLAIFYEPGTGKTIIALAHIRDELVNGRIENALVICPAAIVPNWEKSIREVVKFRGFSQFDVELLQSCVTITSYSKLWRGYDKVVKHRDGTESTSKKHVLREEIDKWWDCIVIDEAHAIGDGQSVQTKACLALAMSASDERYIMTGTPDTGSGNTPSYQKLFGQILFLEPRKWKSFTEWKSKYVLSCDPWGTPYRYDVERCEALKREYGIVARLRECYDMPDSTDTVMPCTLAARKVYDDIASGKIAKYNIRADTGGALFGKLLQVCSGHVKTDDGLLTLKTSKLDTLMSIIDGTDDKVVVFCTYRASVDEIAEHLTKNGISHYTYDGRTKEPLWMNFQEDDTRVFIAQYQRGGVGVDLYASATMVFFEPCFSALLLEQARARILRKGQTRHCRYIYLSTPETKEEEIIDSVRRGVSISRAMLDKWGEELMEQWRRRGN